MTVTSVLSCREMTINKIMNIRTDLVIPADGVIWYMNSRKNDCGEEKYGINSRPHQLIGPVY
jgi:hypothetical protein